MTNSMTNSITCRKFTKIVRHKKRLQQMHKDFLSSPATLRQWAGETLINRCKLFHRRFPDCRISTTYLSKIYRDHKISKKRIRQDKLPVNMTLSNYQMKVTKCREQLGGAIKEKLEVVYCDETIFTRHTYNTSEFAPKYHSYKVSQKDIYIDHVWAVAFVSAERGLVHVETYTCEMNQDFFYRCVEKAWIKMNRQPFALFLDGASYHRANDLQEKLVQLQIRRIVNVSYSPQFNPIEGCFGIVKNHFRRKRVGAMLNSKPLVLQRTIFDSFRQLTKAKVQSMVNKSHHALFGDDLQHLRDRVNDNRLGFSVASSQQD